MYVDYLYYTVEYGGGQISEEKFNSCVRKAEAYIRQLTYARGDIFAVEKDTVKDAVCSVAEVYNAFEGELSGAGKVKSENNDGYSVTYVTEQTDGQTAEELLRKKAYEAAYMYLLPTGWLGRKVGCGCDNQCGYNHL